MPSVVAPVRAGLELHDFNANRVWQSELALSQTGAHSSELRNSSLSCFSPPKRKVEWRTSFSLGILRLDVNVQKNIYEVNSRITIHHIPLTGSPGCGLSWKHSVLVLSATIPLKSLDPPTPFNDPQSSSPPAAHYRFTAARSVTPHLKRGRGFLGSFPEAPTKSTQESSPSVPGARRTPVTAHGSTGLRGAALP